MAFWAEILDLALIEGLNQPSISTLQGTIRGDFEDVLPIPLNLISLLVLYYWSESFDYFRIKPVLQNALSNKP